MSKSCFVVSVIGDENSPERKHADRLFNYIIKPATKLTDHSKVERADHNKDPGSITPQVVNAIQNFELVIADLTYPNPNVYYELAMRHQSGKRIVQLMKAGTKLPFDIQDVRTLPFGFEPEEVEKATAELVEFIKAAEAGSEPITNPITYAGRVIELRSESQPQAETLANILETQNTIVSYLRSIGEKIQASSKQSDISYAAKRLRTLSLDNALSRAVNESPAKDALTVKELSELYDLIVKNAKEALNSGDNSVKHKLKKFDDLDD